MNHSFFCSILVTDNPRCSLTRAALSCCITPVPTSVKLPAGICHPPLVHFSALRTRLLLLYLVMISLKTLAPSSSPLPITNKFNMHNLGTLFQLLENCMCGVSIGVEAGEVDRDQILNVVAGRLHFVSCTFQTCLKWYVKK